MVPTRCSCMACKVSSHHVLHRLLDVQLNCTSITNFLGGSASGLAPCRLAKLCWRFSSCIRFLLALVRTCDRCGCPCASARGNSEVIRDFWESTQTNPCEGFYMAIARPHLSRRHFQPADELLGIIMCRDVLRSQRRSHLLVCQCPPGARSPYCWDVLQ